VDSGRVCDLDVWDGACLVNGWRKLDREVCDLDRRDRRLSPDGEGTSGPSVCVCELLEPRLPKKVLLRRDRLVEAECSGNGSTQEVGLSNVDRGRGCR